MPAFADVVLPVPLDQAFTYAVPEGLTPAVGSLVDAPWGSRRLPGVVVALHDRLPEGLAASKIKPLAARGDAAAPLISAVMIRLVRWAAAYYQAPVGEVMRCALPPATAHAPRQHKVYRLAEVETHGAGIQAGRVTAAQTDILARLAASGGELDAEALRGVVSAGALKTLLTRGVLTVTESTLPPSPPAWMPRPRVERLNIAQQSALAAILEGDSVQPIVLHGVTGSGKTAVYLAAISAMLERDRSALMLVPEIGLTPALFADFEDAFPGQVAVLHSGLSQAERAQHWRRLHAGQARVAVGTRSAVFAPLEALGLILVDEEHDASYKQQESPRYHARDLAVLRAQLSGVRIVLGSATPSLESYAHARSGKYRLVEMTERVEQRPLPKVAVVDMGEDFRRRTDVAAGHRTAAPPRKRATEHETSFSVELLAALKARLEAGQQSLLLINRRGYAPVVMCRSCGATVMCRDCSLALTFHKREHVLTCHFCGYRAPVPAECPSCNSPHLYFIGTGSEKVEEELAAVLPGARIARLDRDTTRGRRHFERVLGEFRDGSYDILVGTQMIAKGHDLPNVTLVGVLQADQGLNFPDFRSAERTFQLLTQVSGRAGRGFAPGEVLFQVLHPGHYAVEAAARVDYAGFFDKESNFRRWMHYPPFAALAAIHLRHSKLERVSAWAETLRRYLDTLQADFPSVKIMGPAPALLARAKTEYRLQFLCKASQRRPLQELLGKVRAFAREQALPATALIVDVDPLNL